MLALLHRLLAPVRALAAGGRLFAGGRAVERARLVHELRLRAVWLRLSCVGLAPQQRAENRYAAEQLDELAKKFFAPLSADQMARPGCADGGTPQASARNGGSPGRLASLTGDSGYRDGERSALGRAPAAASREDARPCEPGADHLVLQ